MKGSLIAVMLIFAVTLYSQDDTSIQTKIKQTYKTNFTGIEKAVWEKSDYGIMAVIVEKGIKTTLLFGKNGRLKEVCARIDEHELPEAVWDALLTDYSDCKTRSIERVDREGNIFYRVELDDRIRKTETLFDEEGLTIASKLIY